MSSVYVREKEINHRGVPIRLVGLCALEGIRITVLTIGGWGDGHVYKN